jgi:hypothetical protein
VNHSPKKILSEVSKGYPRIVTHHGLGSTPGSTTAMGSNGAKSSGIKNCDDQEKAVPMPVPGEALHGLHRNMAKVYAGSIPKVLSEPGLMGRLLYLINQH